MKRKEILFLIDRQGAITSTVKGMKGNGCAEIVEALKKGLGEVQFEQRTSEYFEARETVSKINTRIDD